MEVTRVEVKVALGVTARWGARCITAVVKCKALEPDALGMLDHVSRWILVSHL